MLEFPILSLLIFLPILGTLFILGFTKDDERGAANAKSAALWTSIFTFGVSIYLLFAFDKNNQEFQFTESIAWIIGADINYTLGIDAISLVFIMLTTFLIPVCILCGWDAIEMRVKEFMIAFLMMEAFIIGVFSALDFVLFYLFFEAMLIPMYLIIGVWGGENRVYAAFKFFLYTLLGSVMLLLAILYLYNETGTTDIEKLTYLAPTMSLEVQKYLWLALFASFAVKVPMWPVHTWLPDAHVQAPTAGSVILAGVLLKMGAYGFLRFSLPMLPMASVYFAPYIYVLSVVAVIYTSFVALAQKDMKKLIAYSSVAHMGFVTIGIFSFNAQGLQGAIFQMLSHGFVAAALFLSVGVLYDRMHTKEIAKFGGVTEKMPYFAFIFMFFTLASVGLPGTSGFVGEFLSLVGIYQVNKIFAALTAMGLVLGAAYMLYLYKRVMFGEIVNKEVLALQDVVAREKAYFIPMILCVLVIGVYPTIVTGYLAKPVDILVKRMIVGEDQLLALEEKNDNLTVTKR